MLQPYRDVLSRPGAWQFSVAGLVARAPMAMVGIGIVLMVQTGYGSYGLAGAVSAAYLVASAVASPVLAGLVDRRGQAPVMRPALVVAAAGLVGLTAVGLLRPPAGWAFAAAAVTGAGMGSFGALVRARWSTLLDGEPRALHTAYSLESALDELVFVLGPIVTTLLATTVHPAAGLVAAGTAMVLGGTWFLGQSRTAPTPSGPATRAGTALRCTGMPVLMGVFLAMGTIFGATDVATVAFATEQGHRSLAGVVLAGFALGSMTGGLLYGVRAWTWSAPRRFALAAAGLAVGMSTFTLVGSLGQLVAVMLVTGATIAPMLITGNGLVVELVPADRLTEGLTWVGTALSIGVSAGSAIAGAVIDRAGAHGGFLVAVAAAWFAAVAAVTAVPTLARHTGQRAQDSDQT